MDFIDAAATNDFHKFSTGNCITNYFYNIYHELLDDRDIGWIAKGRFKLLD